MTHGRMRPIRLGVIYPDTGAEDEYENYAVSPPFPLEDSSALPYVVSATDTNRCHGQGWYRSREIWARPIGCVAVVSNLSSTLSHRPLPKAPEPEVAADALTDGPEEIAVCASGGCAGLGVSGKVGVWRLRSPGCATLSTALSRMVSRRAFHASTCLMASPGSVAGVLQSPVFDSTSVATLQWSC